MTDATTDERREKRKERTGCQMKESKLSLDFPFRYSINMLIGCRIDATPLVSIWWLGDLVRHDQGSGRMR